MAIFFNKRKKRNPLDVQAEPKWYATLKSLGLIREKEIAKYLADETTLNPKEAEMAVYQLFKVLLRLLLSGYTVQLGDLGTLRLTAKSEASDTEEECGAQNIKKLNVRFVASADLKASLKKAQYKNAASLSELKDKE